MNIRKAEEKELDAIEAVYAHARRFMKENGNPTQWGDRYPPRAMLEDDIRRGELYVMEEDGRIVGVFLLAIGEDPTYQVIEDGQWRRQEPYGTIHRLASNGSAKGVAAACYEFCKQKCAYLRADTHRDNLPLQHTVEKAGFRRCGIIHIADGTPRIAYDYFAE